MFETDSVTSYIFSNSPKRMLLKVIMRNAANMLSQSPKNKRKNAAPEVSLYAEKIMISNCEGEFKDSFVFFSTSAINTSSFLADCIPLSGVIFPFFSANQLSICVMQIKCWQMLLRRVFPSSPCPVLAERGRTRVAPTWL